MTDFTVKDEATVIKRGYYGSNWFNASEEVIIQQVYANGDIKAAPVGNRYHWGRFTPAELQAIRKLGVKPEGGIDPNHPGLDWLWEDAARIADREGFCREYDRLVKALRVPGRVRSFSIKVASVDGIEVTARVKARSRELAEARLRAQIQTPPAELLAVTA